MISVSDLCFWDWWDWRKWRPVSGWRVVRTSYIWLLIVPVAARLLEPFAGEHKIPLPWLAEGETVTVNMALPFNWVVFLSMAVFFAVARFVYQARCPQIVAWYENYGEYRDRHADLECLVGLSVSAMRELDINQFLLVAKRIIAFGQVPSEKTAALLKRNALTLNEREHILNACAQAMYRSQASDEPRRSSMFAWIRDHAAIATRHKARRIVTVLYLLGFACLIVVVIESLYRVGPLAWSSLTHWWKGGAM